MVTQDWETGAYWDLWSSDGEYKFEPQPTQSCWPLRPIGPAATGAVHVLGVRCCAYSSPSDIAGLMLVAWHGSGLCVCLWADYDYVSHVDVVFGFKNFSGLWESPNHQHQDLQMHSVSVTAIDVVNAS